jgi:hypothetical protein
MSCYSQFLSSAWLSSACHSTYRVCGVVQVFVPAASHAQKALVYHVVRASGSRVGGRLMRPRPWSQPIHIVHMRRHTAGLTTTGAVYAPTHSKVVLVG